MVDAPLFEFGGLGVEVLGVLADCSASGVVVPVGVFCSDLKRQFKVGAEVCSDVVEDVAELLDAANAVELEMGVELRWAGRSVLVRIVRVGQPVRGLDPDPGIEYRGT